MGKDLAGTLYKLLGFFAIIQSVVMLPAAFSWLATDSSRDFVFSRRDRTRRSKADAQCPHCGFWIVRGNYRNDAPCYRCENCDHEIPRELIHPDPGATKPGE